MSNPGRDADIFDQFIEQLERYEGRSSVHRIDRSVSDEAKLAD